MLFLAYIVALVVGAVIGMFGGGGSLLVVAIIYMAQTPRPISLSTAYISILVGVTALIGLIPRIKQKQVNWPTVLALGVPVTLGMVIVRAWLIDLVPDVVCQFGSYHLSKKTLVLLIVATLLVLSFSTITGLIGQNIRTKAHWEKERPTAYYGLLLFFGLVIGMGPAFSGAGGGVLIVPLLVVLFGIEMKTVVGTSLAIITLKSIVGFCAGDVPRLYKLEIPIEWDFLLSYAVVMTIGVLLGSWLVQKFDNDKLKKWFAWFLLGLAIFIVINELVIGPQMAVSRTR